MDLGAVESDRICQSMLECRVENARVDDWHGCGSFPTLLPPGRPEKVSIQTPCPNICEEVLRSEETSSASFT